MTYKLIRNEITNEIDIVNKVMQGRVLSIPFDEANTDYQEYLEWVADGGVVEPADTPEEAE
jgi:hypothetical protein